MQVCVRQHFLQVKTYSLSLSSLSDTCKHGICCIISFVFKHMQIQGFMHVQFIIYSLLHGIRVGDKDNSIENIDIFLIHKYR